MAETLSCNSAMSKILKTTETMLKPNFKNKTEMKTSKHKPLENNPTSLKINIYQQKNTLHIKIFDVTDIYWIL